MSKTDDVNELAQQISAQGRDTLVERLRSAYADAAAAHADIVTVDPDRIEAMVQRAADRADGLQWRRALATVAADRLGVSVVEALGHPAVARAQQLLGAPSYEQSLAELDSRPIPVPAAPEPDPPDAAAGQTSETDRDPQPQAAPAPPDAQDTPASSQTAVPAPWEAVASEAPAVIPGQEELFPVDSALESVEADDAAVELLPEPEPEDLAEPETDVPMADEPATAEHPVAPAPRPGFEPPASYVQSDEDYSDEEIHSDNLQSVSADDAVFDLLPPVDPGEFEQYGEDQLPEVSETAPPPTLEPVPYVPEEDEAAVQFSEQEVQRADAPTQVYEAAPAPPAPVLPDEPFVDPHATQLHDMEAEFAAQDSARAQDGGTPTPAERPSPPEPPREPASEPEPEPEPEYRSELPARPQFPTTEAHAPHFDFADGFDDEPSPTPAPEPSGDLRVRALHLGGVANLGVREETLDLRISEAGLDILEPNEEIIGRLQWSDIDSLEATAARGRLLGKNRTGSRLVVRTKHGDASFEIPDMSGDELRGHVQELAARHRSR